ncbi:hypothetical protein SpCBS45565_g08311 [Spizellomyces sp. 'palustris']|nr:hypothetical protein SpCBS45565_g08311 [Spizellomyces sp. 'palustris']
MAQLYTPQEEDRLRAILTTLPKLNPSIADPARHEKLLSFLQSHVRNKECVEWMVWKVDALDAVQNSLSHSDYRVPSLSLRFLDPPLFNHIYANYLPTLNFLIDTLDSECPPQLLPGCLEAVRMALSSDAAAQWLLDTGRFPNILYRALTSPSLYVVTAACKLLVTIINHPDPIPKSPSPYHHLLANLIITGHLYRVLQAWLQPTAGGSEKLAAVEVVFWLCGSKSEKAYAALTDGELVKTGCGLLTDDDRIMRNRVLDALKTVFVWAPDPYRLLCGTIEADDIRASATKAFERFCQIMSGTLTSQDHLKFHNIPTLLDALEILAVLADRADNSRLRDWIEQVFITTFWRLQERADKFKDIRQLAWEKGEENFGRSIIQQIESCINSVSPHQKNIRKLSALCSLFGALENILNSSRLVHPDNLLTITLEALSCASYQEQNPLARAVLCSLRAILKKDNDCDWNVVVECLLTCLNNPAVRPQNIKLGLDITRWVIDDPDQSKPVLSTLPTRISQTLSKLLADTRWDVRDSALEFMGSLFEWHHDSVSKPCLDFALTHHLAQVIFDRMDDADVYVRCTCLGALRRISENPRGHAYLETHSLLHSLLTKLLTNSLHDTESLVRRASADVIVYLITEKQADKILFQIEHSLLDAKTIRHVMDDVDTEVRALGVRLLEAVWDAGFEASPEEDARWFFEIGGDALCFAGVEDASRVVRKEMYRFLSKVVAMECTTDEMEETGHKRGRASRGRVEEFVKRVKRDVDMNRLGDSCVTEHIYQEVLDVDESVLQEEMETGEGNNVLECYDC